MYTILIVRTIKLQTTHSLTWQKWTIIHYTRRRRRFAAMAMGASPHFMLFDSSSMISKVELLLPEEKSFHLELIVLHCPHSPHFTAYSLVQFIPVLSNSVQASISYGHFWVHFFLALWALQTIPNFLPRCEQTSELWSYISQRISILYSPTCQAGQFLRPNGDESWILSSLLQISSFSPAVRRFGVIIKHLAGKTNLIVDYDWFFINFPSSPQIWGHFHPNPSMPVSFSRLNELLAITSDL